MFYTWISKNKKDCQKLYGNLCPILPLLVSWYSTKKLNNSPIAQIKTMCQIKSFDLPHDLDLSNSTWHVYKGLTATDPRVSIQDVWLNNKSDTL